MLLCAFLPAQWPPVLCWHLMTAYTVNIMLLLITFISTVLCSWALTGLACHSTWVTSFLQHFFFYIYISTKVVFWQHWHGWCHMKLLPSQHILCSPYNSASCHFMQSHICKVHACLAVTCHLHFWQNDQDLLCTTAVILGGVGGGGNTKKCTLQKKILLLLQQGLKPTTFQSQVWHSNHWAIPAP